MYKYNSYPYENLSVKVNDEQTVQFENGLFVTDDKAVAQKLETVPECKRAEGSANPNPETQKAAEKPAEETNENADSNKKKK